MKQFPYITGYVNEVFRRERDRWDFRFARPVFLILYFLIRCVAFPFKFLFHRRSLGFEARVIDSVMCFGLKYLASHEAAELLIRHVQLEPLLYRFLLRHADDDTDAAEASLLNGIDGDFNCRSLKEIAWNNMTVGHDLLSYELVDRFDKDSFLKNLDTLRGERPEDHTVLSKVALEENRKHSYQIFGCTNIVMLIVFTITIFGDFEMIVKALNSFDSDAVVLWCAKHIYAENPNVLIDLDFYMGELANRGHYNSSAFFSDPSQYLYYHICFDEYVYDTLMTVPARG